MAEINTITAELRERAGKGAARATRRAGKVPAVIYGARQAPTLIALEPRAVLRELHRPGWRSRLFRLEGTGETVRALIRDVQLHPVNDQPLHVDFQRLAEGEKIHVSVAVTFLNDTTSVGLKRGGVLNVVRHTVDVVCDPDHIPERFEVDLAPLDINETIRFSSLMGTEQVQPVITDRDFVIATIAPPTKAQEVAPAEAGAPTAAAAPAKGGPAKAAAPAKAAPKAPAAKTGGKK